MPDDKVREMLIMLKPDVHSVKRQEQSVFISRDSLMHNWKARKVKQ